MKGIVAIKWDDSYMHYKIYTLRDGKYNPNYNSAYMSGFPLPYEMREPKTVEETEKVIKKYFPDYLLVTVEEFKKETARRKHIIKFDFKYRGSIG